VKSRCATNVTLYGGQTALTSDVAVWPAANDAKAAPVLNLLR
jgi:hypothetical protein